MGQKLQKSCVGKAGTIAKKEFGIFETMHFRENSEKLEPQIRKNWSRSPRINGRPGTFMLHAWFNVTQH